MPSADAAVLTPEGINADAVERFRRKMKNPILMRLFMLAKLPLGLFAGMRLESIDTDRCRPVIRYGWRNTNPFRSMYFAAQSMAAELSTGALALLAVELAPQSVAMLITGLESTFGKKATGVVSFAAYVTCIRPSTLPASGWTCSSSS